MQEEMLKKKNKKGGTLVSIILWLLILILVIFIVFFNMFSLCEVLGSSMETTLESGQHVLILKNRNAKAGEIIVFDGRPEHDKNLIKRVIGTPGDKLIFATRPGDNSSVNLYRLTNGVYRRLDESYIEVPFYGTGMYELFMAEDPATEIYPEEVPESSIIEVPAQKYFVMGDNRAVSSDSRDFGFIEKRKIVGRAKIILKRESTLEKILLFFYGRDRE